jgi:MarR family 2-MHQ and catechol resistance regulon transcriptional repressor
VTPHRETTTTQLAIGDPGAERHYDDPRVTAMGLLVEVVTGLNARFAPINAEHDLTQAEFEALLRLARTPGGALRMSDLAAQTQLTTSGITRVVDRLERDNLVERRACPTDRRGLFAHVTQAGVARLNAVLPGHLDLIERWLTGPLTKDQLDGLLTALRIVRDGVRPDATAGAQS